MDFGIFVFGFLGFWVLQLCFQSVETDPKLDSEKAAFVSVFTMFIRGVRVVSGVTIYMYIYMYPYIVHNLRDIHMYTYIERGREADRIVNIISN